MKFKRIVLYVLSAIVVIFVGLLIFSPFSKQNGSSKPILLCSIEVNVSADSLFNYLGNSSNASKWSSFVDHISTINADEHIDGTVGSVRRCYVQADEEGMRWDEEILEIIPNKKRLLSIFNFEEFAITSPGLVTEQIYESITDQKTKVSFSLYFKSDAPGFFNIVKMKLSGYRIKSIFDKNLQNIKRICENGK